MAPSSSIIVPQRSFSVGDATFPSGLHVVVEDDPTARVVATAFVVGAGAADDPPGQEGLSHLVEHLAFRSHRPGQPAVSTALALKGIGEWNAETSMDTTSFHQVGAPETLPSMIELDLARMADPLQGVDEEHFAAERGVVLSELKTRDESGRLQELNRALFGQLFPQGHPYGRGVGGTPESVARLTLADARAWVAQHYRPGGMTWVIAGKLDRQKTAELVSRMVPESLARAPAVPDPPPAKKRDSIAEADPPPAPPGLTTVVGPVDRPTLVLGWVLPPAKGPMEPMVAVLPGFVEEGWSEGAESQDAHVVGFEQATVLMLQVELKDDADPAKTLESAKKRWRTEDGVTPAWRGGTLTMNAWMENLFGRVRAATIVSLIRQSESLSTRTLDRAVRVHASASAMTVQAQNDAVAALTYQQVLLTGNDYVTAKRMRAVLIKPQRGSVGEQREPTAVPAAFGPEQVRAEYPADVTARFVRGPGVGKATTFKASNGLEVILIPDPAASGVVTATLGVPGGRRTSRPPGLVDRMRWSRQEYRYKEPAWIGATMHGWWTDDMGFLEYRGASGNLPNLLAMMSERILTRRAVDVPKAALERKPTEPEVESYDQAFWTAFDGPSGAAIRAPGREVAKLSGGDADRFVEQALDPRRATLVIVGDLPEHVNDEVEHWLGRWGARGAEVSNLPASAPASSSGLRVVKGKLAGAELLRIRLACEVPASTLEEELAAELLARDLERQWTTLERETLGRSYGFSSRTSTRRNGTAQIVVSGNVENAAVKRMAVAVALTWKALPQGVGSESRLDRLHWDFARSYNVKFATSEAVASEVVRHRLLGRPISAPDDVAGALMRVTSEHLVAAGQQCQRSSVLGLLGNPTVLDVDMLLPEHPVANR